MKRFALILLLLAPAGCDNSSTTPPPAQGAGSVTFDAQKAESELAELQTRLQNAIENRGNIRLVQAEARRYVERYPKVAAGLLLLGHLELLEGNYTAAADQFERALQIDPRQPEVRLNAGTAALQAGDLDRAERHYAQAISLDTGNARYRVHLADVYIRRGDYDKARLTLLEAIHIDSSAHRAYALLSDVFAKQNQLNLAVDQLEKAIPLAAAEPRYRIGYIRQKARLQLRANHPTDALATLSVLSPEVLADLDVSRQLADCWSMLGDVDRAATHFDQLTTLKPTDPELLAEAARWLIKADRRDEARRTLQQLRTVNPRHPALPDLEQLLTTPTD